MFYQHSHPISQVRKGNFLVSVSDEHFHNEIEIVLCTKGSFIAVIDSQKCSVGEGQFSIAFPNQSHYYLTDKSVDLEYYLIIFSAKLLPEIENIIFTSLPDSPVITSNNPDEQISLFKKAIANSNNGDDFQKIRHSAYCKLICAELFSTLNLIPIKKTDPNILSSIIEYCNQNYKNDIHLSDLEEHLHINKYYISHIFKDKIKSGFNEYIHALRIKTACNLLNDTDDTITQIASNVGYNTVRSFNRSFQKIKGITPSEYREKRK